VLADMVRNSANVVNQYNALADELNNNRYKIGLDTRVVSPISNTDKNRADLEGEEKGTNLVGRLVASAKSDMLASFDESDKAIQSLKPFVSDGNLR
jgi:hypothetical protein